MMKTRERKRTAKKKPDSAAQDGFGYLGGGDSGQWHVSLDESLKDGSLCADIEGPNVYLAFRLDNKAALTRFPSFLRSSEAEEFKLGRFGDARLLFLWDREPGSDRCVILIGPEAHSAVRITLSKADAVHLADAFDQAHADAFG